METLVTLATRDAPSTEAGNAERLRQSVTKRLRDAVRKIGEHDAALGAYLHRSIRTGVSCAYIPVPMIGRTAQRA